MFSTQELLTQCGSEPGMSAVRRRRVSACPDEPWAAGWPAAGWFPPPSVVPGWRGTAPGSWSAQRWPSRGEDRQDIKETDTPCGSSYHAVPPNGCVDVTHGMYYSNFYVLYVLYTRLDIWCATFFQWLVLQLEKKSHGTKLKGYLTRGAHSFYKHYYSGVWSAAWSYAEGGVLCTVGDGELQLTTFVTHASLVTFFGGGSHCVYMASLPIAIVLVMDFESLKKK